MRSLFVRDERQLSVEHAGDRLAYIVVSYGLLVLAVYRSFVERQGAWDLLAIVIAGGLVGWTYRAAHRVLDRQSAIMLALTITVAAGVALAVAVMAGR